MENLNYPILTTRLKQRALLKESFDNGKSLGIDEGFRQANQIIDLATVEIEQQKYEKLIRFLAENNIVILFRSILEETEHSQYGLVIKENQQS